MEKKQIVCRRLDFKGLTNFWKEVNEAYAAGYTYDEDSILMQEVPRVHGIARVTLVRGNKQEEPVLEVEPLKEIIEPVVESVQETVEQPLIVDEEVSESFEDLDNLTKKKELLEYAESFGIEVPEDIKQPAAIKKHIREQLSN